MVLGTELRLGAGDLLWNKNSRLKSVVILLGSGVSFTARLSVKVIFVLVCELNAEVVQTVSDVAKVVELEEFMLNIVCASLISVLFLLSLVVTSALTDFVVELAGKIL